MTLNLLSGRAGAEPTTRPRSVGGRSSKRRQSGQAAAELLLVAPILLLILMFVIGFGLHLYSRMIVAQAANRAARLGAVLYGDSKMPRRQAEQQTEAAAYSALNAGLSGGTYRHADARVVGDNVHVTVVYRGDVIVPFMKPWLGDVIEVRHESIYRIERDS